MSILIFYGSYRSDRMGIRLAEFLVDRFRHRGDAVELIDAKAVNLPMLDRMYKEYPSGKAPEQLERLAGKIRDADGFVFVTGEYNWGVQPGLKNLTDHFLEEWFWRPVAIASYSGGRFAGAHRYTGHEPQDGLRLARRERSRKGNARRPRRRCAPASACSRLCSDGKNSMTRGSAAIRTHSSTSSSRHCRNRCNHSGLAVPVQ